MKSEWVNDIFNMHDKFGVHDWIKNRLKLEDYESLNEFLKFRIKFLEEELNETKDAVNNKDPEEVVDGLIDLCVIAIGTLDIFKVNVDKAWRSVHSANMAKESGVKASRPNPLGLPDMIKPENWKGPDHSDNHGNAKLFLDWEIK